MDKESTTEKICFGISLEATEDLGDTEDFKERQRKFKGFHNDEVKIEDN